jgi:hypothetical protein
VSVIGEHRLCVVSHDLVENRSLRVAALILARWWAATRASPWPESTRRAEFAAVSSRMVERFTTIAMSGWPDTGNRYSDLRRQRQIGRIAQRMRARFVGKAAAPARANQFARKPGR